MWHLWSKMQEKKKIMQSCGIMIVMKKSHSRKELQITSVPIYSATVCNHISKWKLYVGQVHSYFTRHFYRWLYTNHVPRVQQFLRSGTAVNVNSMKISWCFSVVCMFLYKLVFGVVKKSVCLCKCLFCEDTLKKRPKWHSWCHLHD